MDRLNQKVQYIKKFFLLHIIRANMDIYETLPFHTTQYIYSEKENKPMQFYFLFFFNKLVMTKDGLQFEVIYLGLNLF